MKRMITFKSDTQNFYKEENGNKSNTIRRIREIDERFDLVTYMLRTKKYNMIKIIHKQLPKEWFIRKITDVTYFGGYFIMSWVHKHNTLHR